MGVKGRRIKKNLKDEPTLLTGIEDIIKKAKEEGLIDNYHTDIEKIVKQNGLIVKREEMESAKSGYLKNINGKWVIGINSKHHSKRQRFTIAHEFAHYILHIRDSNKGYYEDNTFFRFENDSSLEYKANEFAAQILMPQELVEDAIRTKSKKITELADLFDVSVQALKFRLQDLGYNIKSHG